ncbi:hypothetical protein SAMN05518866_14920 [Sphingobium sp. YR768]|nr:hypothetical protein SAMN05518866_14920 [Sphingobium sp. YR768]
MAVAIARSTHATLQQRDTGKVIQPVPLSEPVFGPRDHGGAIIDRDRNASSLTNLRTNCSWWVPSAMRQPENDAGISINLAGKDDAGMADSFTLYSALNNGTFYGSDRMIGKGGHIKATNPILRREKPVAVHIDDVSRQSIISRRRQTYHIGGVRYDPQRNAGTAPPRGQRDMLFQQALRDQATNYLGDGAFSHSGRLRQFDTRQGSGPSYMLHDPKRAVLRVSDAHACTFVTHRQLRQANFSEAADPQLKQAGS